MRLFTLLLFFLLLCASCTGKSIYKRENLLVEVEGNFLYKEELQAALPLGLTKDDSLLFAENFIRNWIEDALLYNVAISNIPSNKDIEKLVENYRKSLIVHTYQQELIRQKLSSEISDEESAEFYRTNGHLFTLEHPVVKGLFMKVPLSTPQLGDVRKWYRTESQEDLESLEKYSFQHAVNYEYFQDKWMLLSAVLGKIPLKEKNPELYIRNHRQIELQDTAFYYFLNITGYLKAGEQMPYDFALPSINEMLTNLRRVDFMKQVKSDLYQQAINNNKIIYKY